jgi:hypothetical protein
MTAARFVPRRIAVAITLAGAVVAAAYGGAVYGAAGDSPGSHEYAPSAGAFVSAVVFALLALIAARARTRTAWTSVATGAPATVVLSFAFVFVALLWVFVAPFGIAFVGSGASRRASMGHDHH